MANGNEMSEDEKNNGQALAQLAHIGLQLVNIHNHSSLWIVHAITNMEIISHWNNYLYNYDNNDEDLVQHLVLTPVVTSSWAA